MAINFPTSLDSLSNPASGDKLDNPSHSTQHGNANDVLEALETKLGIGASPAGSATAGFPLVHSTGGTTSWAQVGYQGITSGTASSGQVLTAGTATGTSIWSTPSASGLTQIVPTSVAVAGVGSSGSVDANGAVTFSTTTNIDISGAFSSTYQNYRIIYTSTGTGQDLGMRFGTGGTYNSTAGNYRYNLQYAVYTSGTIVGAASGASATTFIVGNTGFYSIVDILSPFATANTGYIFQHSRDDYGFMTGAGAMTVTTSYDQVRFYPTASGTITGTIRIYGYKN